MANFLANLVNSLGQNQMAQPSAMAQAEQPQQVPQGSFLQRLHQFGSDMQNYNNPTWAALEARKSQSIDAPSNVREYQYFQSLPPDQQKEYLRVKRAQQILDLGGTYGVANPVQGGVDPLATKTLAPADQPINAYNKEKASTQGTLDVEAVMNPIIAGREKEATLNAEAMGEENKREKKAVNVNELISKAEKLLPSATSGLLDNIGTKAKSLTGISDAETQADASLDLLAGALTSNVPRMEGPQGVLDVELYKQMAADVGNRNKPSEDRLAALKVMKELNEKYSKDNTQEQTSQGVDAKRARLEELRRKAGR